MRLSNVRSALFAALFATGSAVRTSIYINEIAGYSSLAPCAENRVSAIVRAQASGCGDAQQHTSFSCFCIDQSSRMSSVLSTAVQDFCAAGATITTPLPDVTAALDVFDRYCARSTELSWYARASTTPSAFTTSSAFITSTPPSSSPTPSIASETSASVVSVAPAQSSSNGPTVPLAAIAAPVVIGVLVLIAIVALLFVLRRRKLASKEMSSHTPPTYTARGELEHGGVHEVLSPAPEMTENSVKYRSELETRPVELAGGMAGGK